jgi:RHS repeat-associated protein
MGGVPPGVQGKSEDLLWYPFGDQWTSWGSWADTIYAGMLPCYNCDEYGTPNRSYSPAQGRWLRPDPLAGDITNPQSLNRYAYVMNNPATFIDPLGLSCSDPTDPSPCVQGGTTSITVNGGTPDPIALAWYGDYYQSSMFKFHGLVPPLLLLPPNPSWWSTFARSFITDFSLSSARQPGESWSACVDRTQQSLLGGAGSNVLNALAPVSAVTSILTTSPGTALVPGGGVAGKVVPIRGPVPIPSLAEQIAQGGVEAGTLSAETASLARVAAPVASKIVAPITAVATGLEFGFFGACR